jgi:cyclophilin family peptidyl-prolyl cis-trans isomerase
VVPGFVVQFGINGDPAVHAKWDDKIDDDPVTQSNKRGTLTFATSGPDSRTTQLFISLRDNTTSLDGKGFSPFARVVSGMPYIDEITAEYGERPDQGAIEREGNSYLERDFPNLDYVKTATINESDDGDDTTGN